MLSLPIFISTVANCADEPVFPILFTWSNHDSEIKEVLVIPDDDWLLDASVNSNPQNIDERQLYEFGHEAQDILAEWLSELDTDTVYALDAELVTEMVTAIFDIKGMDPSFEVRSVQEWFDDHGGHFTYHDGDGIYGTPLSLLPPDEQILALLKQAAELAESDDV